MLNVVTTHMADTYFYTCLLFVYVGVFKLLFAAKEGDMNKGKQGVVIMIVGLILLAAA